jgi:hypothetical protein
MIVHAPTKEPVQPITPTKPVIPAKPSPVRVPAPAPLPERRPNPMRESPSPNVPDTMPKPLKPYCPLPG